MRELEGLLFWAWFLLDSEFFGCFSFDSHSNGYQRSTHCWFSQQKWVCSHQCRWGCKSKSCSLSFLLLLSLPYYLECWLLLPMFWCFLLLCLWNPLSYPNSSFWFMPISSIWLHIAWLPHKTGSLADFSCHVCNLLSHIFFIIPVAILKLQLHIVGDEIFSLLFFIIWSFSFLVQMFLFIWSLVSWEIQLHRPDLGVTFTRSLSRFQS